MRDVIPGIVVDRRGRIVRANALACHLFGYERLSGLHLNELLPARSRAVHDRERSAYDRRPRRMGADREVIGMRADGSEIHLWVGLAPLSFGRTAAGMIQAPDGLPRAPLNPA